jgi:hypothetical protein
MEKEQQRLDIEAKKGHRELDKERDKRQVCNYLRCLFDAIHFGSFYHFLGLDVVIFKSCLHMIDMAASFCSADPYTSKCIFLFF